MYSQNSPRQAPSNNFSGAGQPNYDMQANMGHGHMAEEEGFPPTYPALSPNGHYITTDYPGGYLSVPASAHTPQPAYTNVTGHNGYLQPGYPPTYQVPQQFQHPQMSVGADPYALGGSSPNSAESLWNSEQPCERHGLLDYKNSYQKLNRSPKNVADPNYRRSLSPRERALKENGLFVCSYCGDRFARKDRMENCWNSHYQIKAFVCNGECGDNACRQPYANADALRKHQWKKEQREVICEWCNNPTSRPNIARHRTRCPKRPADYRGN